MKLFPLAAVLALCSCRAALAVNYDGAPPPERAFLESLLEEEALASLGIRLVSPEENGPAGKYRAGMAIDFSRSWEYENAFGDIPLSRTWLVPRADPLEGRTNTSLGACLGGEETLIPLRELAPPYTALRVDNRSAGDGDYPLVMVTGIRIYSFGSGVQKKVRALREALEGAPKPLMEAPPELLWIASGGDLMLARGAQEILLREGPGGIFGGTAELLKDADLALVNLEGAVSRRGTRVRKTYNFRFDPKTAAALASAGIDAALLANNHAFDYGETAFLDTLAHLGDAGIGAAGAGLNEAAAARPFLFSKGNTLVRVFGIASFPRERSGWDGLAAAAGPDRAGILHAGKGGGELLKSGFAEDAGTIRAGTGRDGPPGTTLDVVLFHGGQEWSSRPDAATRAYYTDMVRHGADLVIGSHPHIVQGFEWVEGKPVFWSLGNYVFAGMEHTGGGDEGLFIRLGFLDGRMAYLEPYPLTLNHARTEIAPAEKLSRFYTLSRELGRTE
jgi:poly-gamma-glutamate synthesis protein (capsule biosynthesis protein)